MKTIQEMEQSMQDYLGKRFPERQNLMVEQMDRTIGAGYSYETYLLNISWQDGQSRVSEGLVVRMEPETGLVPPYDVRPQYEVQKRLQGSGIPAPKAHWLEMDKNILGRPFYVMERIEGENFNLRWFGHPEERKLLEQDYIQLLARLHGLDWQAYDLSVLGVPEDERDFARKQLARWQWVIEEHQFYPQPILAEVLSWAKNNIPPMEKTTLCHGDFHADNFFVRDGRIVALFDWEMAAIGDPVLDIAWACLFSKLHGFWNETELLQSYEEVTGTKVNRESLLFWKVFAQIRLAAIFTAGIKAGMIYSPEPNLKLAGALVLLLPQVLDDAARMLGI